MSFTFLMTFFGLIYKNIQNSVNKRIAFSIIITHKLYFTYPEYLYLFNSFLDMLLYFTYELMNYNSTQLFIFLVYLYLHFY